MSMDIWFPTKIICEDIGQKYKEKLHREMMDVFQKQDMKPLPWSRGLHSLSTHDFMQNLVEEFEMHQFKSVLYEVLEKYPKFVNPEALERGYKIGESWFTLTESYQRSDRHSHGTFDLSGVYYLQTTGQDGNIVFTNESARNYYEDFKENRAVYEPKEGRFLLFPGWLPHQVQENTTFSKRISFSFNISFTR
jgi:uncharacterized protein (TIGR02466 family)